MTIQTYKAAVAGALLLSTSGFAPSSAQAQAVANPANSSCTQTDTLSKRVRFADMHRAMQVLGRRDAWARQLSVFDLGVRQKTATPAGLAEFLTFAAGSGLGWSAQEEAAWQVVIARLGLAMAGSNLHVPQVTLVKTLGREEFDAAYTRGDAIMLPRSKASLATTDPRGAFFLLAHEVFHVLSRADSRLRDNLYALLGFERVEGFEYPTELESRRLSNPDAFEYLHTLSVQAGSQRVDVLPVLQSRLPLNEAINLPNFFAALDIVLLPVDRNTGEVRRDSNGNLVMYNFGNTNWVPLMLRNSSFIIQPEELLADNFATLMEWRSQGSLPPANPAGFPANDVNLLTAIRDIVVRGCKE
jgi:hypothetical protein